MNQFEENYIPDEQEIIDMSIELSPWHEFSLINTDGTISDTRDMILWCTKHFGPGPTGGAYPGAPDSVSNWYATWFGFYFKNEQDLTMFALRWS